MEEVWLAKKQGAGVSKTVVVKMIHPDLNAQKEAQQRFFDEARIVAQIQHPNVVQFFEFGEQDNVFYQVMEYIEGYASEKIIEQAKRINRPIPIPIICRIIADAAQGLGFIHNLTDENGVCLELVHCDISPQNLLMSKTGTLKIINFGMAKARQKTFRTRTGIIVGKLQYMSPEQLSSKDLDHRSDIYSLGLVLYELLTLRPRFSGNGLLEIFYEAFNEPPPIITDLRLDCPSELMYCVQKALAQNKEERYAHAYELEDDLERYIHANGIPITQRTIAAYIEDLFVGNEKAREETNCIYASAMLSDIELEDFQYGKTQEVRKRIDEDLTSVDLNYDLKSWIVYNDSEYGEETVWQTAHGAVVDDEQAILQVAQEAIIGNEKADDSTIVSGFSHNETDVQYSPSLASLMNSSTALQQTYFPFPSGHQLVPMSKIFISYRRDDSAHVTGFVYERLVAHFGKQAVCMDIDTIPLGINFKAYLDSVIARCEVVLVVIGRQWLHVTNQWGMRRLDDPMDFVRIEIESALLRNIPVIPLLVGSTMPALNELPETLAELAYRNGMKVRPAPDFERDLDRLVRSLDELFSLK
jgi:serine/threonine protein kinase